MTQISDITLDQWIDYTNSIKALDDELCQIEVITDDNLKNIKASRNYVARAFATSRYFNWGLTYVDEVLEAYDNLLKQFKIEHEYNSLLLALEIMTFGQFIDAKMIIQAGKELNHWELMKYVLVIISDDMPYKPEYLNEQHEVFKNIGTTPIETVIIAAQCWQQFNEQVNANYTLFQDSGDDTEGENMKAHMERWGWVNFLKSIAKTKVFDIAGSGMNSIDCARQAKLDDVLTWASEEKEFNIASFRDIKK